VSLTIAAWCYVARRAWFRRYATLIVSVSALGFLTYFVFPAAPPWLASRAGYLPHTVRIVHSVWAALGLDGPARIFGGSTELANPVAALPSLHAAWPFLALLFFWNKAPRGRWVILVYNAVMVTVLVYGAEHYFSDVLLGWIYAVVVFVVVNRIFDYLDGRNAPRHLESKPGRATRLRAPVRSRRPSARRESLDHAGTTRRRRALPDVGHRVGEVVHRFA